MELKALEPRLGKWLSVDELRGFLADLPEEVCERIPINRKLLNLASDFVGEKRGRWEHPDWESFLARLSRERFLVSDEVKAPIGNILEIFKAYYNSNRFQAIMERRAEPVPPSPAVPKEAAPARPSPVPPKEAAPNRPSPVAPKEAAQVRPAREAAPAKPSRGSAAPKPGTAKRPLDS